MTGGVGRRGWRKVEPGWGFARNTVPGSIRQTGAFHTVLLRALGVPQRWGHRVEAWGGGWDARPLLLPQPERLQSYLFYILRVCVNFCVMKGLRDFKLKSGNHCYGH